MRYLITKKYFPPNLKEDDYDDHIYFTCFCPNCGAESYAEFMYKGHSKSRDAARKGHEKEAQVAVCPICREKLLREKGYFMPGRRVWDSGDEEDILKYYEPNPEHHYVLSGYPLSADANFKYMESLRRRDEPVEMQKRVDDFATSNDLPAAIASPSENVRNVPDELKKYILTLLRLENNIYSLKQQLSNLYYRRLCNKRAVIFAKNEPAYNSKVEIERKRMAHQKALKEIGNAETYRPVINIDYPTEPVAPILGKPGLFNKKKVLEENAALTVKYQAEMEAYRKEVQRCDDEKARLIAEKRTAVLTEAQEKADAAKAALDEAERGMDDKIKAVEARPIPAKAVKEVLDKEIAEAEELLKKTFAARNELYAFDIIFGKYRNAVALSSFYEYLMSGRCTSLEGADGAYNIYESEIRANRVIAQLDTVISSLEDIKQNQYMMYEELCSINSSLDSLNYTMDAALKSIRGIEANTNHMSEYMEHISQNSDVIAHNTAVTAYYSKVNAQLTNALGYMVAFK